MKTPDEGNPSTPFVICIVVFFFGTVGFLLGRGVGWF